VVRVSEWESVWRVSRVVASIHYGVTGGCVDGGVGSVAVTWVVM
jgi:hypothetical protein